MGAEPAWQWLRSATRARRTTVTTTVATVAAISVAVSLVIGLPLLPASAAGLVLGPNKEAGEQIGWPAFVADVAAVWRQIPPGMRHSAVIVTMNYGEAGAIEHYGAADGLPQPYSGHMSYADWGPPPDSSTGPVLLVGPVPERDFTGCRVVAHHDNGLDLDNDEQGAPLSLCTGTTAPWSRIWPDLRRFY